jgi:hypothetical protein
MSGSLKKRGALSEGCSAENQDRCGNATEQNSKNFPADERAKRPMTPAERQKLRRKRSAANKGVICPEIDMHEITTTLVEEGLLRVEEIDDRGAVTKAVERVLKLLPKLLHASRVTSNRWDW